MVNFKKLAGIFFTSFVITCSLSLKTSAQDKYFFEKITVSNGLSNSVVTCTYQDHLGYLWIGTVDGFNRYDGYDIKVFKNIPNDSTSLPNNTVSSIGEDADGNLLVGTNDNVSFYNRVNDTFTNISIEKGAQVNRSTVTNITRDSKNNIWISTVFTGIQRFEPATKTFKGINYLDLNGVVNSFANLRYIWKVVELKNGNILAADKESGVFIYNPEKDIFQPYFPDQKQNLKGVSLVFEDSAGKLWFAAHGDIYIYDPATFDLKPCTISKKLEIPDRNINYFSIYEESRDKILIGSDFGILETDITGNKFSLITEKFLNANPINFYKDNFGIFWISTVGSGLIKFDPAKKPFRFFKLTGNDDTEGKVVQITDIIPDPLKNDGLLVSAGTQGIFSFDRTTGKATKIQSLLSARGRYNLLSDDKNNLWFTDNSELKKLNLKTKQTERFSILNTKFFRGDFRISSIKFGPDKNIWLSNVNGVEIFNPESKKFRYLPSITNKPVTRDLYAQVSSILSAKKPVSEFLKVGEAQTLSKNFTLENPAKVLIVNLGEGRQTGVKITSFDFGWLEDSTGKIIWTADKIQNTFYAGGGYKNRLALGALSLPKGKYKLNYVSDVGHSYGNFNVVSPPDSVWYGIQVHTINDKQFEEISSEINKASDNTHYAPFEIVNDFRFSRKYNNTVWLVTGGTGLIKYNFTDSTYKNFTFDDEKQTFPLINQITGILEDKDGILWLATQVGLIRFNPETEKFKIITQADGLVGNFISFMKEDLNGNLWVGTSGGISMLNKNSTSEQLTFINYDNTDGLHDLPLNKSIALTSDGELFYGGFGGINGFYPGSSNNTLSKPVITSMKISGSSVENLAGDIDLDKSISEATQLELPYSDNNLSFEFASIHYSRPEKNKLAFMLEGIDKDWIYTTRRFASYNNLPPGDYVFKLKGSNGDGIWNPEEVSLRILINPPLWRTTAAYITYFFLFIGFLFLTDKFQKKRILAKTKIELTLKEAELRAVAAESQAKIIQLENDRKSQELDEARNLQLSMLPKNLPQFPHLDIAVYMKTATEVGGDYYDFNVGIDGTLTVVLGDATGHGMRAGTMVTSAKSLFNSYAANPDILFTFKEMTRCIRQMQFQSLAMCMTMMKIQNNQLHMSAAGMPPIYLYRNKSREVEEFLFEGMPLGTMENFPYQLKQTELFKGDTLLLMSDGFPELKNNHDQLYGYKRARNSFEEVAEKEPEDIITYLKEEGSRWVNDNDPDDDVTFVVIKIK
ncbi:MAG: SpoIIE family protein phosphatase [Bacteroidetes bacterium]|nr:SpoIIE family protein phosphatase [Bacteroidota bacterium]